MFFKDPIKESMTYLNRGKHIKKQVKKNKSIIYGAQAIKKQIGFVARPTQDYDIAARAPRKSARQITRTLNKRSGGNPYYVKQAIHPGTWKVQHVGMDHKRNTRDDIEIADFTKPERKLKTRTIEGIKYAHLSESIKDKRKSLSDPAYAFRHSKDRDDLQRIKFARKHNIKYRK